MTTQSDGNGRFEVRDDLSGLGGGECVGDITRCGVGSLPGDDGVLVDARDDDKRIDSRLAQHHSPARRGGSRPAE